MDGPLPSHHYKPLYLLIGIAIAVNFSGLFVHLMDPDAGVYASVSRNMLLRHDWINLWFQDKDWLDKPHLPFWITAFSFKLFGMHDWSYKLPGILMVMLGAYYTYLFARANYNRTVGLWAAFILLTAMHILISNNDVRAEPYLTGFVIAAIYHFSRSLLRNFSWHLIAGCFFAACAMMTKGLFTLAPIGGAIAGHLFLTKQWKQIFHYRWLVAAIVISVFISPELYCLFLQFDQHPEKIMFGKDHVSGIRFFLWDSQFGRFTNTGPIKGKGDPSFFLHTLLWAFLPWAFLMYAALFIKTRSIFTKKASEGEYFMISGSLLTLIIFSVSKFQLPYYTNIIFPMLSVVTAVYVVRMIDTSNKTFRIIQYIQIILLLIAVIALFIVFKPDENYLARIILIILLVLLLLFIQRITGIVSVAIPYARSGLAVLIVAAFMNMVFYPALLKYQSGNQAAFYINDHYPGSPVARLSLYIPSGEFYLKEHIQPIDTITLKEKKFPAGGLAFLAQEELAQFDRLGIKYERLKEFPEYHITMLTLKFISTKTRLGQLKTNYLVRIL